MATCITVYSYSINKRPSRGMDVETIERTAAIATWTLLLNDEVALLENPGAQHKTLLRTAHTLHRSHVIDRDDLSDLLELADGALAYAVELQLDNVAR